MKSILDPTFEYRNADHTDVRLTFERIRRELRDKDQRANPGRKADGVDAVAGQNHSKRKLYGVGGV